MVDIKFIAVKLKTKPTKHFLISYTKQNRCFMIGIGGRYKWFRSKIEKLGKYVGKITYSFHSQELCH